MSGYMRGQGIGPNIAGSGLSNCSCSVIDQVLDFIPEGLTVIGIMSRTSM